MNQERIKERIMQRAAKLWGHNELRAETSFDPVVSLLLSAMASELEKLGFELENSQSRIVERILDIMFPEEISGAVPAKSLLQVFPVENHCKISFYNHFKADKKNYNVFSPIEGGSQDIYFCPTIEAELTTSKIEYIVHGNIVKHVENFFSNNVLLKSENYLPPGEIWVGIRCQDKEDLENLMFYIDINNNYQKELFFHYVKQVKVYFGDQEFELKKGFNVDQQGIDVENIIKKNYSELEYIYKEVNEYYYSNYFTLKEKIRFTGKQLNKELFTRYFPESKLSEETDIIWLKFKFSEAVVEDILQNINITLNCIPVINMCNVKTYRRVTGKLNIIPIQSDDYFLALDYVSDDAGQRFDLKNYSFEPDGATAILRKGGVSRFDQRSASELLQYLLELIKDETAAFSGIGGDSAKEMLVQINQNIAALHQLAKEKSFSYANNPYLIITTNSNIETSCNISYWNTQAEQGNNVKPGTLFMAEESKNSAFDRTAIMITTSFGGRKSLSPQDKIFEFRNALLTRGRVVTIADIKVFGINHFKNAITDIDVRKGTKKEVALKEGFSRTIDIYLLRNSEMYNMDDVQWKYLCHSFLLQLKNISFNIYPYRIFENGMKV